MMSIRSRAVAERLDPPTGAWPSSISDCTRLTRRAYSAGSAPKASDTIIDTAIADARTGRSMVMPAARGKSGGRSEGSAR